MNLILFEFLQCFTAKVDNMEIVQGVKAIPVTDRLISLRSTFTVDLKRDSC